MNSGEQIFEPVVCFVIGPIGDRLAPPGTEERARYEESIQTWGEVIQPACEGCGLTPIRADLIAQPGEITEQIFRHLRDADVVIADVTRANPNVMYELGLRHTMPRLTIQIGESGNLPFDIGAIRTIRFNRTDHGLVEARKQLAVAIQAGLTSEPATQFVTATRVWNELSGNALTLGERESKLDLESFEEDDEAGFIELIAGAEEAMTGSVVTMQGIGQAIEEIGSLFTAATAAVAESDAKGGGFGPRLLIANNLARDLEAPAERLEEGAQLYVDQMQQIDPGLRKLIDLAREDPEAGEAMGEFSGIIQGLATSTDQALSALDTLAELASGLGNISRNLRPPGRRIARALRDFGDAARLVYGWRDAIEDAFPTEI